MTDLAHTFIDKLIGREGNYSNNPNDPGGETMWGITVAEARICGYTGPMSQMPRDTAVDIYYQKYYVKTGFYKITGMLPKVAEEMLDTGVNMGVAARDPQKWLQRSLNLCNRRGKDYPDVPVTGIIDDATMGALRGLIAKRTPYGAEQLLLKNLNGFQWERYRDITEKETNSKQEDFFCGWVANRIGLL
jgi:lysozyme family protein